MNELFAHTISRIDFVEGMVRIELSVLSPGPSETTAVEPKHVLHMPLAGFMRGALTIDGFIREMMRRGVLPQPPAQPGQQAPAGQGEASRSPNFG